jgi:hypothetical protein
MQRCRLRLAVSPNLGTLPLFDESLATSSDEAVNYRRRTSTSLNMQGGFND